MEKYYGFDLGDAESAVARLGRKDAGVPEVLAVREAKSFITVQTGLLYAVITLFIDGTSLVLLVELLVCAVRVRILRKRQREVPHES